MGLGIVTIQSYNWALSGIYQYMTTPDKGTEDIE